MSRSRIRGRAERSASLALLALVSGCSLQHSKPEASDTVTNWLWRCTDSSDCRGGLSCLSAICSLPCEAPHASACARLSLDAICDRASAACDLACESAASCQVLGPDYGCEAGRCRAPSESEAPSLEPEPRQLENDSGARSSSLALPLAIALQTVDAGSSDGVFGAPVESAFDPGAVFTLTDPAVEAGQPFAAWKSDHFLVAWTADTYLRPGCRLDLADLHASGRYVTRRLEIASMCSVTWDEQGDAVAHGNLFGEGGSFGIQVTDLRSGKTSAPLFFESQATPQLASIPGSSDWLVTWPHHDSDEAVTRVAAARYRPGVPSFVAGPWQIARHSSAFPLAAAAGGDAWIRLSPTGELHHLDGLASPTSPGPDYVPQVDTLGLQDASDVEIVSAGNNVQVIATTDARLRSFRIAADGTRSAAVEVALPEQPTEGARMMDSSAVYAPELERLGVCTVAREGLWFLTLDAQGQLVDAPIAIEANRKGALSNDTRTALGCDIAWSGDTFLVVWQSVDGELKGAPPPILEDRPVIHSIKARLIPATDLTAASGR